MSLIMEIPFKNFTPRVPPFNVTRRLRFSSDADNVRLTNACIIIIIIIIIKNRQGAIGYLWLPISVTQYY